MTKMIATAACILFFSTLVTASEINDQRNLPDSELISSKTHQGFMLAQSDNELGACVHSNNVTGQKMCNEVEKGFCNKGFPWVTSTKFYPGSACCGNDVC